MQNSRMTIARSFLFLLVIALSLIASGQQEKAQHLDPAKCNAEARTYWDAPPEFWEKYWKQCPPEQVGRVEDEPVYAARPDLMPKLEVGSVQPLPADSKRRSAEVVLSVIITSRGTVGEATVIRGCGDKAIDEIAIETVKVWRFKPASRDKKAVNVKQNLVVQFERGAD